MGASHELGPYNSLELYLYKSNSPGRRVQCNPANTLPWCVVAGLAAWEVGERGEGLPVNEVILLEFGGFVGTPAAKLPALIFPMRTVPWTAPPPAQQRPAAAIEAVGDHRHEGSSQPARAYQRTARARSQSCHGMANSR